MNAPASRALAGLAALLLTGPAVAEINKCRQGGEILYQQAPCPAGSQVMPPPAAAPEPSAFAAEEARRRAQDDIAAAAAIRKREARDLQAQERQRAAAAEQAAKCIRLRERLDADASGKRKTSRFKAEQRRYTRECGK